LLIGSVPVFDTFNSFDRAEFLIIDIRMMSDSYKWFMNVSLWEKNTLSILYRNFILFLELNSKFLDFLINQNSRDYTQGHDELNRLNSVIISIHANISKQVNVGHKIVELVTMRHKKLWYFTIILSSERYLGFLSFFFSFGIICAFFIIIHSCILYFELEP